MCLKGPFWVRYHHQPLPFPSCSAHEGSSGRWAGVGAGTGRSGGQGARGRTKRGARERRGRHKGFASPERSSISKKDGYSRSRSEAFVSRARREAAERGARASVALMRSLSRGWRVEQVSGSSSSSNRGRVAKDGSGSSSGGATSGRGDKRRHQQRGKGGWRGLPGRQARQGRGWGVAAAQQLVVCALR